MDLIYSLLPVATKQRIEMEENRMILMSVAKLQESPSLVTIYCYLFDIFVFSAFCVLHCSSIGVSYCAVLWIPFVFPVHFRLSEFSQFCFLVFLILSKASLADSTISWKYSCLPVIMD